MQAIAIFDIDGVVRDVSQSYRRAIADTVEYFTEGGYRPAPQDIDRLKTEGCWNNDWKASEEMIYRYFEQQGQSREAIALRENANYDTIVDYFQRRYRGDQPEEPETWNGYICDEPLLMSAAYLQLLATAGIPWGFFSGATPGSAKFVLENRLGLVDPPLVAMGDAPDKPDPAGLLMMVDRLGGSDPAIPVCYAGDTVADMYTVQRARESQPERSWFGIGVLPPHVQTDAERVEAYSEGLKQAGAAIVIPHVERLTPSVLRRLISQINSF